MRGILINPWTKEITEVQVEEGLQAMYVLLSNPAPEVRVDCFAIGFMWQNGDTLYVDDEGLFKAQAFFSVNGQAQAMTGRGLILGSDDEGNSVDIKSSLTDIQNEIRFISPAKGTSRWS